MMMFDLLWLMIVFWVLMLKGVRFLLRGCVLDVECFLFIVVSLFVCIMVFSLKVLRIFVLGSRFVLVVVYRMYWGGMSFG